MKRVVVAAGTRGRVWRFSAKVEQKAMSESVKMEHMKRIKQAEREGKTTPVFRKANDSYIVNPYDPNFVIKDTSVFAIDNTDLFAVENGFLLMDSIRAEVYKRVDAHPLFDKLGPHSAEIISIAIRHGRGIRVKDKLYKFSSFLKVDLEKSIIQLITVPTSRTTVVDM